MNLLDYKLKIPTDRETLRQLHLFLNQQYKSLSSDGEELFVLRETLAILQLLRRKITGLSNPKSITLNLFQIKAIEYCYHWFSNGSEILELPQLIQLISKIKAKSNVSNVVISV